MSHPGTFIESICTETRDFAAAAEARKEERSRSAVTAALFKRFRGVWWVSKATVAVSSLELVEAS